MAVPTTRTDLSATAASNSPAGSEAIGTNADNYIRALSQFIRENYNDIQNKQDSDAALDDISALAVTDGNFIVGNGTNWVAESGATVRASLGLGSAAVAALIDEDDMVSDSATAVPSQQSVKAYVDSAVSLVTSGTFNPTITTNATDFSSVTYDPARGGRYVKIGQLVHFQLVMSTDAITVGSASGNLEIGGLPFTAVASTGSTGDGNSAVSVSNAAGFAGEEPINARVKANDTRIALYYRSSVTGDDAVNVVADAATGANSNNITISGTYIAAS